MGTDLVTQLIETQDRLNKVNALLDSSVNQIELSAAAYVALAAEQDRLTELLGTLA